MDDSSSPNVRVELARNDDLYDVTVTLTGWSSEDLENTAQALLNSTFKSQTVAKLIRESLSLVDGSLG